MTELKHYIIFGPPGSGKGTFCQRVTKLRTEIQHISTGDIFRSNIKNETELGRKVKKIIARGELVSDELTNELVKDKLNSIKDESWTLDGYPRNLNQAQFLDNLTNIDIVLILDVEESILIQRILGRFGCDCGYIYNKFTIPPKVKKGEDLYLCDNCGKEIVFKQRTDDNEESIKTRLKTYHDYAKPVIDYYNEKGLIKLIDSDKVLELTHEEITDLLGY